MPPNHFLSRRWIYGILVARHALIHYLNQGLHDMNGQNPQENDLSIQEQLNLLNLQLSLQDKLMGCLIRSLRQQPALLDRFEDECHLLVDELGETHPEVVDVRSQYLEKILRLDKRN